MGTLLGRQRDQGLVGEVAACPVLGPLTGGGQCAGGGTFGQGAGVGVRHGRADMGVLDLEEVTEDRCEGGCLDSGQVDRSRSVPSSRLPRGRARAVGHEDVVQTDEFGGDGLSGQIGGVGAAFASLHEPGLDVGIGRDVEESLEELAALLRSGSKEGRELTLRQDDDLAELGQPHPDEVEDAVGNLGVRGAEHLPLPAGQHLERNLGRDVNDA